MLPRFIADRTKKDSRRKIRARKSNEQNTIASPLVLITWESAYLDPE